MCVKKNRYKKLKREKKGNCFYYHFLSSLPRWNYLERRRKECIFILGCTCSRVSGDWRCKYIKIKSIDCFEKKKKKTEKRVVLLDVFFPILLPNQKVLFSLRTSAP